MKEMNFWNNTNSQSTINHACIYDPTNGLVHRCKISIHYKKLFKVEFGFGNIMQIFKDRLYSKSQNDNSIYHISLMSVSFSSFSFHQSLYAENKDPSLFLYRISA